MSTGYTIIYHRSGYSSIDMVSIAKVLYKLGLMEVEDMMYYYGYLQRRVHQDKVWTVNYACRV